jgi:hypothetical protein
MRKLVKTLTAMLLIAVMSVFLFGCGGDEEPPVTTDNPFGLVGLGVKPEGEVVSPYDTTVTGDAAITLAVEMYDLACANDKNATNRAILSICHTSNVSVMGDNNRMDNKVLLNILEIKSGNEFYRIDYRIKEDIPLFNAMPMLEDAINKSLELVTTERKYTNTSMDYLKYEKTHNALTDADGIPYADWTDAEDVTTEQKEMQIFAASQDGDVRPTEHTVNTNTVSEATITYNETEGFYAVNMTLDCSLDETTENTRHYIQEGSKADNAAYQTITVQFEMWNNGYFKSFGTNEYWTAQLDFKIMKVGVESTFPYYNEYSYDPDDCVISKYYTNDDFIDNYNA